MISQKLKLLVDCIGSRANHHSMIYILLFSPFDITFHIMYTKLNLSNVESNVRWMHFLIELQIAIRERFKMGIVFKKIYDIFN